MSCMSVIFRGGQCSAERVNFYVKRGPYTHGYVKGWQLVDMTGKVVISGDPGRPSSAFEYQTARYPTRKFLMDDVQHMNECWERRQAKSPSVV